MMFAISFDMIVAKLEEHYGSVTGAYAEIRKILISHDFYWIQGSTYLTKNDDLGEVFKTMYHLASIEWFRLSVRDIQTFEVKHWSDFTAIVKNYPKSIFEKSKL